MSNVDASTANELGGTKPNDKGVSDQMALCVELRDVLKLPKFLPGELGPRPLPRKPRLRRADKKGPAKGQPQTADNSDAQPLLPINEAWQKGRKAIEPILARAAKSSISPLEKDGYRQQLEDADALSLDFDSIDAAVDKLSALEKLVLKAVEEAEAAPEGKDRGSKKLRKKAELEQSRAEKELLAEATLSRLPSALDLRVPRAILAEHKIRVPEEQEVLDEFDILDDLLNNKSLKADPDKMREKLLAIGEAMKSAFDRQKRMAAALKKIPAPENTAKAGLGYLDDELQAYQEVTRLSAGMADHVPHSWMAQWTPNFSKRIDNLTASVEEKKQNLEEAKKGFSPELIAEHKQALDKGITANSTRKLDRVEFFFDRQTKSIGPQEQKALMKMTDEVLTVGTKILDSGGKLSDVQKALSHIPEAWWPPQFIDYLQAWRKTEREMQRLEVAKMFAKADKVDTALDTVDGVLSFVGFLGTVGSTVSGIGKAASGGGAEGQPWTESKEIQKCIKGFVGSIQDVLNVGREGTATMDKEFFQRENSVLEVFGSPEKMEAASAKLLEITKNTANSVYTTANSIGGLTGIPDTAVLMTSVLPGISLAAASIDLYLAIRSLAKHARTLSKTKGMIPDAELDWCRGLDEDGGAFVRALGNEVSARKLQIGKDSVDVADKSLQVGSATAFLVGGHVGAGVGLGLKVSGKVISFGGKVVFANIEWSQANIAKQLIKEAQAGSPSARIELMSECGLYAKMYIAILAREGHKKAYEFIADRGIEESDLEGGPLALKIVVDEMLKDADQPDETKVEDSLLLANISGIGGKGAISFARTIGKLGTSLGEWIEGKADSNRETPYDEKWKHKPEHVQLTPAAWSAAKGEAKNAGLLDMPTGIGDEMKRVEESYVKLQKVGNDKPKEVKERTIDVLNSLDELYRTLMDYEAVTNPQGPKKTLQLHKGMYEYLSALKSKVTEERLVFDKLLISSGGKQIDWSTKNKNPDPVEWEKTFKDCADKSCLSNDDLGVRQALAVFKTAETDPSMKDKEDLQKRRSAILKAYDAGTGALRALDMLYGSARECQGLRTYIDNIKGIVSAKMRYWDELTVTVAGIDWWLPVPNDEFSAAAWRKVWSTAVKDGMVIAKEKDGGLGETLTKAEEAKGKLAADNDPLSKMKLRLSYQQALARIFSASRACLTAQATAPATLTEYVKAIGKWAQSTIQSVRDEQGNVAFKAERKFDPKSCETSYENAKKAGAVGSSEGKMGLVKKALSDFVESESAFQTANSKKDRKAERKAVQERENALKAVISAVADAMTVEGYAENETMRIYLDWLDTEANDLQQSSVFKSILDGSSKEYEAFDPEPYTLDKDGWEKVKKQAVDAGLIADAPTGLGSVLDAANKKYKTWKESELTEQLKLKEVTAEALKTANKLSEQLAGATKQKNLNTYFETLAYALKMKLADVQTDASVPFKPADFDPWSKSAWNKVKAEAVVRRLMKKDEKTGLGDALAGVKTAIGDWIKLDTAERMAKRGSVEKLVVKVRDIAINYRDTINDLGLKNYFGQMVKESERQIADLERDGVKDIKLKLPKFEWSRTNWQEVKKLAVEAQVLTNKDTGFGKALDEAQKSLDSFKKTKEKKDNAKIATARATAEPLVKIAREKASSMSAGTSHPNLKNYLDQAVSMADAMLDELSPDQVEFSPPVFDWTNSVDWEDKVRKVAIALGLLDEKASSKFGDELKDASHLYYEFGNALKEKNDTKKQASRSLAEPAVTKALQTATVLKDQSQHKNLKTYFDQCVQKANEWLNVLRIQ